MQRVKSHTVPTNLISITIVQSYTGKLLAGHLTAISSVLGMRQCIRNEAAYWERGSVLGMRQCTGNEAVY